MVVVGGFKITSCGPDPKEGSSSAADAELNERSKVGPAHVHHSIGTVNFSFCHTFILEYICSLDRFCFIC